GIEAIRDAVAKEIADGIEFAKASPAPEIATLEDYVYTEHA
ncbi:MAG: pyruvate dehydrogenase (acetyl-transferring) E1 component subunit alpha, partial [Mesorhizobium sp.]